MRPILCLHLAFLVLLSGIPCALGQTNGFEFPELVAENEPPLLGQPAIVTASFSDVGNVGIAGTAETASKESVAKEIAAIEATSDLSGEIQADCLARLKKANDWLDCQSSAK